MALLGSLMVQFGADLSNLTSGVASAKSQIASVGDAPAAASGGFLSGIGNMAGGVMDFATQVGSAIAGVQMMGQAAVGLAGALLGPAATAETTSLSFTTLLHSTQAAHQEMQDLNTFAAGTPMQTQWVDNAAAKILAFGGTTKDVIPEITSIGDSLSGLGKLSETSLNSIVDVFGKITAQGKLSGGEMMQLSSWGIPAWQALSVSMHKPIDVLQKMVSQGAIPAKTAIAALEGGMEKTFGGGMAAQANTFTGLISTLQSNWQIMMASIGGPALKVAEQGLTGIGNALSSPAFQTFGTGVGVAIGNALSGIGSAAAGLAPVFQGVMDNFRVLGANFQAAADGAAPLFDALGHLGGLLAGGLPGAVSQVTRVFDLLSIVFADGATVVSSVLAPAMRIVGQVFQSAQRAVEPILNTIEGQFIPATENLEAVITPMVSGIVDWIAQSNIVPTVIGDIGAVVNDLIGGLSGLTNGIASVIGFFQQNQDAATLLMIPLGLLGGYFISLGVTAIASFIAAAPGMIAGFASGAAGAWAMAAGVIAATWPFIAIGAVVAAVVAIIVLSIHHWNDIVKVITGIWGNLGGFFTGLWHGIQGVFSGIGDWFSGIFTGAANMVTSAFSGIGAFFTGLWSGVVNDFKGMINFVISGINGFINFMNGVKISLPAVVVAGIQILPAFSIGLPHLGTIPLLAQGGTLLNSGDVVVGDAGPELLHLPGGAQVSPLRGGAGGGGSAQPLVLQIDGQTLGEILMPIIGPLIDQHVRLQTGSRGAL